MKLLIVLSAAMIASTSAYAQSDSIDGPRDQSLTPSARGLSRQEDLTSTQVRVPHPGASRGSRKSHTGPSSHEADSAAEKSICSNC